MKLSWLSFLIHVCNTHVKLRSCTFMFSLKMVFYQAPLILNIDLCPGADLRKLVSFNSGKKTNNILNGKKAKVHTQGRGCLPDDCSHIPEVPPRQMLSWQHLHGYHPTVKQDEALEYSKANWQLSRSFTD